MSALIYEKVGPVAWLIMNRPEKRNAINSEIIAGITAGLDAAEKDPDVRVVVLGGAGEKAFTAGFDLKESMDHNITDVVERRDDTAKEKDFFMRIWNFPKPVIASIQGYCIGGGNTFAMVSDLVIASEDAKFGNPEMLLGYQPQIPLEIWKMPYNKVREFLYLSEYFDAHEMERLGVVNRVVPYAELREKTQEMAERVAKIPPESMRLMKYSLNKCYELRGLRNTVDYQTEMFNLGRIHMQQKEVDQFRADIASGGLSSALKKQYN